MARFLKPSSIKAPVVPKYKWSSYYIQITYLILINMNMKFLKLIILNIFITLPQAVEANDYENFHRYFKRFFIELFSPAIVEGVTMICAKDIDIMYYDDRKEFRKLFMEQDELANNHIWFFDKLINGVVGSVKNTFLDLILPNEYEEGIVDLLVKFLFKYSEQMISFRFAVDCYIKELKLNPDNSKLVRNLNLLFRAFDGVGWKNELIILLRYELSEKWSMAKKIKSDIIKAKNNEQRYGVYGHLLGYILGDTVVRDVEKRRKGLRR
jgi:hypothetical protein